MRSTLELSGGKVESWAGAGIRTRTRGEVEIIFVGDLLKLQEASYPAQVATAVWMTASPRFRRGC
jgi:hypothetical protein